MYGNNSDAIPIVILCVVVFVLVVALVWLVIEYVTGDSVASFLKKRPDIICGFIFVLLVLFLKSWVFIIFIAAIAILLGFVFFRSLFENFSEQEPIKKIMSVLGLAITLFVIFMAVKEMVEDKPSKVIDGRKIECGNCKYCSEIKSCAEAYFLLNQCGCSSLDRDKDGIPCENLCR